MQIEYPERLLHYLSVFGKATFTPVIFHKRGVDYATIDLETAVELAMGLEEEINSELTKENGMRAYMRFIGHSLVGFNKKGDEITRYMVEIVPYNEKVSDDELLDISREYLHRLPKVIRNYRKKHKS
jgi:hypothetical protein